MGRKKKKASKPKPLAKPEDLEPGEIVEERELEPGEIVEETDQEYSASDSDNAIPENYHLQLLSSLRLLAAAPEH